MGGNWPLVRLYANGPQIHDAEEQVLDGSQPATARSVERHYPFSCRRPGSQVSTFRKVSDYFFP